MKTSYRKLFDDFFWLLPIPFVYAVSFIFKFFNVYISGEWLFITYSIICSIFVFIRCQESPVDVLFPKKAKIKWSLVLLTPFCIILLITLPKLAYIRPSYLREMLNFFINNGFDFNSKLFVNKIPLISIICLVIITPFIEELLFRYVFYTSMKARYESIPIAIIVSSCFFSALHVFKGSNFFQLVSIFFVAFFCAYVYERTAVFLFSIVLHACYNFLGIFFQSMVFANQVFFLIFLTAISFLVLLLALIFFIVRIIVRKILGQKNRSIQLSGEMPAMTETIGSMEMKPQVETNDLDSDPNT